METRYGEGVFGREDGTRPADPSFTVRRISSGSQKEVE